MFLPIEHPTDLRFQLSRIGINPSNDSEVASGYGCLRLLEYIVQLRKWRLPFAAYKNEDVHRLLAGVFPEAVEAIDRNLEVADFWKDFENTYNSATKIPVETFIRSVCPNFLTDPNACIQLLTSGKIETKGCSPYFSRFLHVFFCWRSKADTVEKAYGIYYNLVLSTGLTALTRELFFKLYQTEFCFSLSDGSLARSISNAAQASRIFSSASIPLYLQIDLFRAIYESRPVAKKNFNLFEHIRKSRNPYPFMFENMAGLEKSFNEAADMLRNVKPSEFLETIITESQLTKTAMDDFRAPDVVIPRRRKRRGDIPDSITECSYVFSTIANYLTATGTKRVLIVNPSIPFIRKWCMNMSPAEVETHFITEWESSAAILESEFSGRYQKCHFSAITQFSVKPDEYDACLLFYRDYVDTQRHMKFGRSMMQAVCGKTYYWLLPDEKAKQIFEESSINEEYKLAEFVDAMDILPTEAFTSEPKKKVFLRFVQKKTDRPVTLVGYLCQNDPDLKKLLYPIRNDIKATRQVLAGEDTIRTVYRNGGIISRTERQRKLPRKYRFSPELTVWYTLNPPKSDAHLTPKVKAYLCNYPTQKQKRNILKRGKEIPGAHIWKTNYPEDSIPAWIGQEAIFAPAVHKAAVEMILAQYKQNAPISLRTFWYISSASAIPIGSEQGFILNFFLRGPHTLSLNVGSSLKEDYIAAVDSFAKELNVRSEEVRDEYLRYVWDFLCELLDKAVEKGYYKINPLEDLISRIRIRHSEYHELRNALTKKTFTLDEEVLLLSAIQEDDSPLAIGTMIRLYTGMPPTQICALRYRDFKGIPHTKGYQFLVYQSIAKAGSAPSALRRPEEYRRIPVAPILAERICRHIQSLEDKLGVKVKDTDYFIVSENLLDGTIPEKLKPYAPSTLQKYSKKMIETIGIEHVTLFIPDEKEGSIESDFTHYQSDIFRTNLRYRLKNTCGFTNSECDYMLGVQMKNTFAKHYCDFTNPFSQLVMLSKLSWWCTCHQPGERKPEIKHISLRNSHLSVSPVGSGCASASLSLRTSPESEGIPADLTITVESAHGWNGSINLIGEDIEHDG